MYLAIHEYIRMELLLASITPLFAAAQSRLHICTLQTITTCSLALAQATQHLLLHSRLRPAGQSETLERYLLLCLDVKKAVCKPERLCVLGACKLELTGFESCIALLLQLPCKPRQPTLLYSCSDLHACHKVSRHRPVQLGVHAHTAVVWS